jgi:hypothetical protein
VFAMSTLHDWVPDPGSIICWHASAAASANARHAPASAVPPSYQQTQHLRRYCDHAARGLEMTRMMIFTWEVAGRCDARHVPQLVRVQGCGTHRSAHHRRSR